MSIHRRSIRCQDRQYNWYRLGNPIQSRNMRPQYVVVAVLFMSWQNLICGDDIFYSKGKQRDNVGSSLVCAIGGICGGVVGYWLGSRRSGKQNRKVQTENNDLIEYIKLQTELYNLQERAWRDQYNDLDKKYKELHRDTLDRDYDEFKAPDVDNDDMISRTEFETYVTKYLSSFPELSEKDFPKFVEFDLNADGKVSFAEWQEYLSQQKALEADKKKKDEGEGDQDFADVLTTLYDKSGGSVSSKDPSHGRKKAFGAAI